MALSNKHLDGTGLAQLWANVKKYFVPKEANKGLSTNDYTTAEKTKLGGIEEGAQVNVQADWDATEGDAFIKNKPGEATQEKAGLMSAADKKKVDGMQTALDGKADKADTLAGYGITDAFTKEEVTTSLGKKANKAFTLEGYGIGDAYTKTAADAAIKKAVDAAVAGVYKIKGSIAFANLPTQGMVAGDVYNITDDFTTTEAFVEGAGKECKAGSNVVYTENGWDVMAGTYDFSDFVMKADIQFLSNDEIDAICTMPA